VFTRRFILIYKLEEIPLYDWIIEVLNYDFDPDFEISGGFFTGSNGLL
tara:strand:- start:2695 stop:2838 length:144 start_codon:yes stop_codon:yes gene_type:complete